MHESLSEVSCGVSLTLLNTGRYQRTRTLREDLYRVRFEGSPLFGQSAYVSSSITLVIVHLTSYDSISTYAGL